MGPVAAEKGAIVVDNSSAFRMDPNVPLIIPEVNSAAMSHIKLKGRAGKGALIANPNCSTIICLMAATPLHRHAKVVRMVVSTYQAASGAGAAAMEELELQTREVLEGKEPTCNIFKQQYAFNLFSHNAPVLSNGYNEEEMKLVKETRKIWNDNDVKVTATCIRVPVMRAHAESVNLQFDKPLDEMLASRRSAGKKLTFEDREYTVEELKPESFDGVDIALFSAGGSISKEMGPVAAEKGAIVVDNSSAFRMDPNVPLIIPEVNSAAMSHIKLKGRAGKGALIANPNCSTIICLMAATPLHRHAKVVRMVVSTYQAASGAGAAAMEELELQTREVLEGKEPTCNIFKQQYAFNLFSHNAPVLSNGYNEEEMKLVKETRKIWNDNDVKVTATCIRVPVMRAHAESVNLQFDKPLDEDTARRILKEAAGVVVIDDRASNLFPTPLEVSKKDDVAVGRIRQDLSQEGNHGLDIFVCGDQIRKGAALNAVQIAEKLL
ncbi:uncharacterized protein LOC109847724 [Asparagus officinalis]|uniref:uncharacterized protein LOC109847724 n=1 Tax=Asparagus officinalis TaxID=4686 RepID=UPI00098E0C39|nr:uncharacterized protein LOC109847724 [Asparagus officinalis]